MQLEEPQVAIPQAVDCSSMDGQVTAIAAGGGFTAFLTCEPDKCQSLWIRACTWHCM